MDQSMRTTLREVSPFTSRKYWLSVCHLSYLLVTWPGTRPDAGQHAPCGGGLEFGGKRCMCDTNETLLMGLVWPE